MRTAAARRPTAASRGAFPASPHAPLPEAVGRAVERARDYLLGLQNPAGEWCAELEGDTILESEYILAMVFLGRPEEARVHKAAEYIRRQQLPHGGWAAYAGGAVEVSASVKAYFVLKLLGDDPDAPAMVKARQAILAAGGIDACNTYTKIYLAIFGQVKWSKCPAIPPELILFPPSFPFNIYEMSSWSRAIVVPLSMIWALKPRVEVPARANIEELWAGVKVPVPTDVTKFTGRRAFWTGFFFLADRFVKLIEWSPWKPFRRRALREARTWIEARLEKSDGVGAIIPPIINTIYAFRSLGMPLDHPVLAGQIRELERLEIEEEDTLRVQPCFSALWDTVQVLNSLLDAGVVPDDPAILRAARWVLDHEVREKGDWQVKVQNVEPGGWYFEYANEPYPDCDDTAEVLTALSKIRFSDPEEDERRRAAMARGLTWLLAMQNRDGGWAAFDKACDREFLTYVPFADHNAMLDPSCEDITGRVLETLNALGFPDDHRVVRRAVQFLRRRQAPDGTWYGRWGCNYLYGTWLALWGLRCVGRDVGSERMRRAAAWFQRIQNPDGGWGELPSSYDRPEVKGRGPSTASQTAWALLGLFASGDFDSDAARRGLAHLLEAQRGDGSWYDATWTGTGFPRVFYLRYHLYATQFPLLALAIYRQHLARIAA
ncbi:MAG: squalene--hopene cyclase [Planctomycetota bacterium]